MTPPTSDKRRIAAAFNRAAPVYAANAILQNRVADSLADRLALFRIAPERILDAGSGCGNGTTQLRRRFPKAQVLAFDLAYEMLRTHRGRGIRRWFAGERFVCGDVEQLPFADRSIDLVFSSLALQWSTDLDAALAEFARVLRPGGLLLFSSLGPDTLRELRSSWAAVDADAHVNTFLDMHDIGDRLIHAGLAGPVLDVEHVTMTYADVTAVLRDLKSIGADQVLGPRHPRLTSPGRMKRMIAQYENHRRDGLIPATYEVVYAHAWAPAAGDRPQDGSTVAHFPLSALRRRNRESAPR
jgi:malonyl-CoA O-methyltransferase